MKPTIVIAQNWKAFEWWCSKNNVSTDDRKVAIPLIEKSDRYRLYGRAVQGTKWVVVGKIDDKHMELFKSELRRFGVIPREDVNASSSDHA